MSPLVNNVLIVIYCDLLMFPGSFCLVSHAQIVLSRAHLQLILPLHVRTYNKHCSVTCALSRADNKSAPEFWRFILRQDRKQVMLQKRKQPIDNNDIYIFMYKENKIQKQQSPSARIWPEPGAKTNQQWSQMGWMLAHHRDGLSSSSFYVILNGSVGLWVGIQCAGDLVSQTSEVRILHPAEEDNLSPFEPKIAFLCKSIEINNKHVYGPNQVQKPTSSEVKSRPLHFTNYCGAKIFKLNLGFV